MTAAQVVALSLASLGASPRAAEPNDVLPEAPAKALVVAACTNCHAAPDMVTKRRTADEWDEVIAKMVGRGAALTEPQQDEVYAYFVTHFGPQTPPAGAKAPSPAPATGG